MRKPIYIVGAGGLGRGVLETINAITNKHRNWEIKGFIDDNIEIHKRMIHNIEVLGDLDYLLKIESFANVVLAIAKPDIKAIVYERLSKNKNLFFPNIIHPKVHLSPSVEIGWGNIVSENVSFSADVEIGSFTLIHFNSSIGHDVCISDYSTIYPGASVSGFVQLKDKCEIGSNACVLPSNIVGEKAIVGAGALVNREVQPKTTVVGVPARVIQKGGV